MAYDLTPEKLQEISVRVVGKFMTKQADLNTLIANEGKSLELNPEQLKRVIETSNTIAYLRQLEDAKDRSFEFPIAEYRDVMGKMILPDAASPAVPTAESNGPALTTPPEKQEVTSSLSEQEKVAMLIKETLRVKQVLTKMASEEMIMCFKLDELASKVQRDPLALEKLAHIFKEEDLKNVSVLCGLEKTAATSNSVFSNSDLRDVISLNSLFKEAKELLNERKKKEDFVKKATAILIEKKAFSPVETVGKAVGLGVRLAGKGIKGGIKGVSKGVSSLTAGKTLGQRVTGAADIGAAALAASTMSHHNPVWESIHG